MAEETEVTSPLEAGTKPRPPLSAEAKAERIARLRGGGKPEPESYTVVSPWTTEPGGTAAHKEGETLAASEIVVSDTVVQNVQARENPKRQKAGLPELTADEARASHIKGLADAGMLRANYPTTSEKPEPEAEAEDEDPENAAAED